jgi:hypothetical protein
MCKATDRLLMWHAAKTVAAVRHNCNSGMCRAATSVVAAWGLKITPIQLFKQVVAAHHITLKLQLWHVVLCYIDDFTCGAPLQRYFAGDATFPNHATSKVIKTLKTFFKI